MSDARAVTYTAADLRAWRARERLSQRAVGRLFGVGQRLVSLWEAGLTPRDFTKRFERVLTQFYR